MNSNKASTSNILKSIKPNKRAVFFVLLAVLVLGFSFFFITNFSHAQATPAPTQTTPKPQAMTQAQIEQIDGWKNWDPKTPPPAGTKLSDKQLGSTADLYNAQYYYKLVPDNAFTPVTTVSNALSLAGQTIKEYAIGAILEAVTGVLLIIASFLKLLVYYAAATLDLTLNPSLYNFTSNRMIVQGWTTVRDVCNLFFLLVLLFIAICTILKIEKYHAKKTLLMLIIMALLINFSKPIAIFIFDGSQLLMNEFLKQMGGTQGTGQTTSTVVAKASQIANIVYETLPPVKGATTAIAIQYLFGVVFLFMLAVAYLVTAIMLLIRIVAIMMLIIVSPLAFFAAIIPDFSKMSSQWWSSLFEYSYYGPAAAFFLLLATQLESALPPMQKISTTNGQIDVTVNSIIQYLLVIIFLYASIIMAKKFGGVAGAAVVGNANRFMKWGAGMTKGGGMWGAGARGVAWGGRTTGISGGVGQMIGASRFGKYLTKKGREDAQKDREASVAEGLGVKGAKEGREKQKVADLEERWKKEGRGKEDFKKSINSKDAVERKAAARQLMKQGEAGLVINSEIARQGLTGSAITQFYDKELGNLSSNDLGKHDLEALSASPEGRQWVESRLKDYNTDPRLISNMLSGGHTKNFNFIRNLRNNKVLNSPGTEQNSQARGRQGQNDKEKIEVVDERSPRSRTVYDADGNPVT